MALPIERWARQAIALEAHGNHEPVASKRVLDDINELSALKRQEWLERSRGLHASGVPQALNGVFAGLTALPPAGTLANVASINGENAQWTTSLWTPINANATQAPQAYRIAAYYQVITSTSPASLTVNPRLGSVTAGSSSTGAIQMGASASITLTASITTNWYLTGDIVLRAVGLPGANSTAMGAFHLMAKDTSSGNGTIVTNQLMGYTAASYDASIATGFVLGNANTVTTINYSTLGIVWSSWN